MDLERVAEARQDPRVERLEAANRTLARALAELISSASFAQRHGLGESISYAVADAREALRLAVA